MSSRRKTPVEPAAEETNAPEQEAALLPEELQKALDEAKKALADTEKALADAKAELAGEKEKYLRLAAEYDNFRKRSSRERDNIYADVKADTLEKVLPIYDNLERALKQETQDEAYRKGVEMTMNQFSETLKNLGVAPIEAVGQTFDPAVHNAVMHTEDPDKGENEVVAEFQKGFKMGDRIIRFSMVQVAN